MGVAHSSDSPPSWSSSDKHRDLRDINFWLNRYRNTDVFNYFEKRVSKDFVQWNVGVGPTASFKRAVSGIFVEMMTKLFIYDLVIKVDLKQEAAHGLGIMDMLIFGVAKELGLLDQEYNRLNENNEDLRYYTYGREHNTISLKKYLASSIVPQIIFQKLSMRRYLLVIENLYQPIQPGAFTEKVGLPPPSWNHSNWLISTTSHDVHDKSIPGYWYKRRTTPTEDEILMLILSAMHQAAKYIYTKIRHKDQQYWHLVALRCFHYAMLLFPHYLPPHADGAGQQTLNPLAAITPDELIRQWNAAGIFPSLEQGAQERIGDETDGLFTNSFDSIFKVGYIILEAFQEYSLLTLPFSPATQANEASKSAAHFLAYHGLIVENLPATNGLCDDNHPGLEHMQWISHMLDQGLQVSREWLRQGASGPIAFIVRHCSQESSLLAKIISENFLIKFPFLRVLDLSYTMLESLPPSICYLSKLELLSLRGCCNLKSPFSFPDTESTLPENKSKRKLSLLYLDLSYSNINMFHDDFFHRMPNLQELLLVKCSNLEELPSSIVALSSLTRLELIGTQIKSFSGEMFEGMKKLQSLKLIENKNFLFVPGLISKASSLTNLQIEGCKSIAGVDITLEGHPALKSFSFIGAPHVRRISLHGCRNLEYFDIKEAGVLEELDLSATGIKELPADIPNLPQLRRLLLMDVASLRRFPWHELQRLPDVFCLDHCSNRTVNHFNPQAAQLCISDSRLFYSFNERTRGLVRGGQLLKSFYVRVTSCKATVREMQGEEDMVSTSELVSVSTYADVNRRYLIDKVQMVPMGDVPPIRETERHVEISAAELYPHGLKHFLEITKSIIMSDDTHVSCLTDLSDLDELEDCMLLRCHEMVDAFKKLFSTYLGQSLKNAFVSHLERLTHFYRPPSGSGMKIRGKFSALKHLVLEHCPRLERVVPHESGLPSLVTLDILFCYNLKVIFYNNNRRSGGFNLPRLQRMHLQELPLLEHLRDDGAVLIAPAWVELHVRGCWSLRHLPRLRQQPKKAVRVSGERAWWTKLRWDDHHVPTHRSCYEPRLPPASASFREGIVPKSYLR